MNALDDEAELAKQFRRRPWKWLVGVIALVGVGAAVAWWPERVEPVSPFLAFGRDALPLWSLAARQEPAREPAAWTRVTQAGAGWPRLSAALEGVHRAWPERTQLETAVAQFNDVVTDAGLPLWVDPVWYDEKPLLITYEVQAREHWHRVDNSAQVELLQVRRLDTISLDLGVLGHAHGQQPLVLTDAVEQQVVGLLSKKAPKVDGNVGIASAAAQTVWRAHLERVVDSANLLKAEQLLADREAKMVELESRLQDGAFRVTRPERLVYGPAFFKNLEKFTKPSGRRAPILLERDLRAAERVDASLADSHALSALATAIGAVASVIASHEAHHALDHRPLPPPKLLKELIADDDDTGFAERSSRELRAFLGEVHDAPVDPCLSLAAIIEQAWGEFAQGTTHFYAAHALIRSVAASIPGDGAPDELDDNGVARFVQVACALPPEQLRAAAATAFQSLYTEQMLFIERN